MKNVLAFRCKKVSCIYFLFIVLQNAIQHTRSLTKSIYCQQPSPDRLTLRYFSTSLIVLINQVSNGSVLAPVVDGRLKRLYVRLGNAVVRVFVDFLALGLDYFCGRTWNHKPKTRLYLGHSIWDHFMVVRQSSDNLNKATILHSVLRIGGKCCSGSI